MNFEEYTKKFNGNVDAALKAFAHDFVFKENKSVNESDKKLIHRELIEKKSGEEVSKKYKAYLEKFWQSRAYLSFLSKKVTEEALEEPIKAKFSKINNPEVNPYKEDAKKELIKSSIALVSITALGLGAAQLGVSNAVIGTSALFLGTIFTEKAVENVSDYFKYKSDYKKYLKIMSKEKADKDNNTGIR